VARGDRLAAHLAHRCMVGGTVSYSSIVGRENICVRGLETRWTLPVESRSRSGKGSEYRQSCSPVHRRPGVLLYGIGPSVFNVRENRRYRGYDRRTSSNTRQDELLRVDSLAGAPRDLESAGQQPVPIAFSDRVHRFLRGRYRGEIFSLSTIRKNDVIFRVSVLVDRPESYSFRTAPVRPAW